MKSLRFKSKALLLVILPLAFELLFVSALLMSAQSMEKAANAERVARTTADKVNDILQSLYKIQTIGPFHGSVNWVVGSMQFPHEELAAQLARVKGDIKALESMTSPETRPTIDHVRSRLETLIQAINSLESTVAEAQRYLLQTNEIKPETIAAYTSTNRKLWELARTEFAELKDLVAAQQERAEQCLTVQEQLSKSMTFRVFAGLAASMALCLGLVIYFNKSTTNRIAGIIDNANRFAKGMELLPSSADTDEIAEVDRAFRSLTEQIRTALNSEKNSFEKAANPILVMDEQAIVTASNQAFSNFLQYEPGELIGKSVQPLIHAEDWPPLQAQLTTGGTAVSALRMVKRTGDVAETSWSVFSPHNSENMFSVIHDITERQRAVSFRQELLAMVSHDLRTPLATIMGFYVLLESEMFGPVPPAVLEQLPEINGVTEQMLSLVNDLLDLEKIEANKMRLSLIETDLRQLITEILDKNHLFASTVSFAADEHAGPAQIHCDEFRLEQSLINVLSFVTTHLKAVSLNLLAESNGYTIEIAGSAAGNEEIDWYSLFDKVKQIERLRVDEEADLRLSVAKMLIEMHNGTMSADGNKDAYRLSLFLLKQPTLSTC